MTNSLYFYFYSFVFECKLYVFYPYKCCRVFMKIEVESRVLLLERVGKHEGRIVNKCYLTLTTYWMDKGGDLLLKGLSSLTK